MTPPVLDWGALSPLIILGIGVVALPLVEVGLARMIKEQRTWLSRPMTRELAGTMMAFLTAAILVLALPFTLAGVSTPATAPSAGSIVLDPLAGFLGVVVLLGSLMTVLVSIRYLAEDRSNRGEYYALILASVMGMMLLVSATDLIMLFLSLELMTIPVYALAGYQRGELRSNESALKYFVIGSFAAAILLYGSSLLYGTTGSVSLAQIGARFDPENPVAMLGAGLLIVGLAFKIGSVPFHQWAPDVYEGAPTTVTGFMATAVKVTAFGVLLRVMAVTFGATDASFYWPLWWMAVLSMTLGNVMAIVQRSVKRMLAYSSIAHAGYALVGVCVATEAGYAAVLFYLLAYTFMTIGAFAVVAIVNRDDIDDFAGLHATRPFLAGVMAVAMFALAGIPATAGFMGKYQLFSAAVERWNDPGVGDQSLLWLAIIGVLNSALSLGYYLRIPVVMYMQEPKAGAVATSDSGFFGSMVLLGCTAAVFLLGIVPQSVGLFWDVDALAAAATAAQALIP